MTNDWTSGADEDRRWDRLVDGTLSESEYRELLAVLDEQPGGWRRCALAFLEAQAWGRELRQMRDHWVSGAEVAHVKPQRMSATGLRRWRTWLSIAALVMVAFASGWSLRGPRPATAPVSSVVDNSASAPQQQIARNETNNPLPPAAPSGLPAADGPPLENVTLWVNAADGTVRELQVPVFPHESQFSDWLRRAGPGVPANVEQALRQLGYQVQRDRRLTPVRAEGNRRLYVPVEQVEITPAALQPIQ